MPYKFIRKRYKNTPAILSLLLLVFLNFDSLAQETNFSALKGEIKTTDGSIAYAQIWMPDLQIGTITDSLGFFLLNHLPIGNHLLQIKSIGYQTHEQKIQILANETITLNVVLKPDMLQLNEVVVSATRSTISIEKAPVLVSKISSQTLETTQSVTLAEGLRFSPGLRIENNCQNCGFTQLRMNGLEGPYSQILINSRPLVSALAGVYALELLPTQMIDRVEVVRGGGSVLFGGNAIAGTVNIITKDPTANSFSVGSNLALTKFAIPDQNNTFRGSVVSKKGNSGVILYGFNRSRQPFDANNDGFSEVPKIENTTLGFDAFWQPTALSKLKIGGFNINEFRRGGSQFHLLPHQTEITEQLNHKIRGFSAQFEQLSKSKKNQLAIYTSMQQINRASYYGGGGRVLQPTDTLNDEDLFALNAYGNAIDYTIVGGWQYTFGMGNKLVTTIGNEWQANHVKDAMPGYNRSINQAVQSLGTYAQSTFQANKRLQLIVGGRFDYISINGNYELESDAFTNVVQKPIFVPRVAALYQLNEQMRFRLSFAKGYRAPQAFDEDLHIETVGGNARFIQISNDLKTEHSNSLSSSLQITKFLGNTQVSWVIEGFVTQLKNPFILVNAQVLDNGIQIINKTNGSGSIVGGSNIEGNFAFSRKWLLQTGLTLQGGTFRKPETIWEAEEETDLRPNVTTKKILRTPNVYGYYNLQFSPNTKLKLALSGVFTGAMLVPHVIEPETAFTILKETPAFFDNTIKISYNIAKFRKHILQLNGGLINIFDSYQRDFDIGPNRDGGYVYGPMQARTMFFGIKYEIN